MIVLCFPHVNINLYSCEYRLELEQFWGEQYKGEKVDEKNISSYLHEYALDFYDFVYGVTNIVKECRSAV